MGPIHWLILFVFLGSVFFILKMARRSSERQQHCEGLNANLISCPDCDGVVSRLTHSCPHCGRPITSETTPKPPETTTEATEVEPAVEQEEAKLLLSKLVASGDIAETVEADQAKVKGTGLQLTDLEVEAFVGSRSEYYLKVWDRGNWRFNWAAFFFSVGWLFYRKLYLSGFIIIGIILGVSILAELGADAAQRGTGSPPDSSRGLAGLLGIICGVCGNQWYLSHARKVVRSVRAQGLPEAEYLRAVSKRGGTNVRVFWVALGLTPLTLLAWWFWG